MTSTIAETAAMKTYNFDIKVALIGYVSVGKSTVLNALIGDKFSEVALKRTNAGVNFFRIIQPTENDGADPEKGWSTIIFSVFSLVPKTRRSNRISFASYSRLFKPIRNISTPRPPAVCKHYEPSIIIRAERNSFHGATLFFI